MPNTHSTNLTRTDTEYWSRNDTTKLLLRDNITIIAWIKTTQSGGFNQDAICGRSVNPTDREWTLFLDSIVGGSEKLRFLTRISSTNQFLLSTVALSTTPLNNWVAIAVTRNTTTGDVKFYEAGSQLGTTLSGTSGTIDASTLSLLVGNGLSSNTWGGRLDDVRIYDAVLTGSEISSRHSNPCADDAHAGLRARYLFDNNGNDSTANNEDLTGVNTPTFSTDIAYVCAVATIGAKNLMTMGVGN